MISGVSIFIRGPVGGLVWRRGVHLKKRRKIAARTISRPCEPFLLGRGCQTFVHQGEGYGGRRGRWQINQIGEAPVESLGREIVANPTAVFLFAML